MIWSIITDKRVTDDQSRHDICRPAPGGSRDMAHSSHRWPSENRRHTLQSAPGTRSIRGRLSHAGTGGAVGPAGLFRVEGQSLRAAPPI
jgi:hypothetical protein